MSHLPTITPLVGIIAREHTASSHVDYDEARQEGLIHAWEAETARPDAPREYLVAAARNGIIGAVTGRKPFGAPSRQGRAEPLNDARPFTFDEETGEDTEASVEDLRAAHLFHLAEIAPARKEVRDRVGYLSDADRDLVRRRFWQGQTWPEIAVATGKRTEAVRRRFVDHIAPVLAGDLEHLREVVAA